MHSLRTRITLLTICVIVIAVTAVSLLSVYFIRNNERRQSDQLLLLLCETGELNLDYYFDSVQKSIDRVTSFAEEDLNGRPKEELAVHVENVREFFEETAYKTNGVLTFYYRIDPEFSGDEEGFWYTNLEGDEFEPHKVTDISLYDTEDTSELIWFTVPKQTGETVWLPPYTTENLDVRVISCNAPVYWRGQFAGVVGIEIDCAVMAEQVDNIRLYSNGYAFLTSEDGEVLFYHPRIDVAELADEELPGAPEGLAGESTFLEYTFEGVKKHAAWLPLNNGMRLTVSVPVSETEGSWQSLIREILLVSLAVLLIMSLFTMIYTRRITHPLEMLTEAAEKVDQGHYDFVLDYSRDDELGRLTSTFKRLANNMKDHINDLNRRVYVDALTSVKNKGAFSVAVEDLQKRIDEGKKPPAFAVCVFDCDDLKAVNDRYGHDKGDVYLKTACRLVCEVFRHSPVFRIGGDEFAVILQNDDYRRREELAGIFMKSAEEITAAAENRWEQVQMAMGLAVYDPKTDPNVIDTVRRADREMYANKRERKSIRTLI